MRRPVRISLQVGCGDRVGGGRKQLPEKNPELRSALDRLIDPTPRGDPENPLRCTCKRAANLAAILRQQGYVISERTATRLLHDLGYRLHANTTPLEGRQNPDRDAQFQFRDRRVRAFQRRGQLVISVDTTKTEIIGAFQTAGTKWISQDSRNR